MPYHVLPHHCKWLYIDNYKVYHTILSHKIIFLEIPLLFESNCQKYCDYIIGIDANEETQIRNLKARGSKKSTR